jgi:hypothetical protein
VHPKQGPQHLVPSRRKQSNERATVEYPGTAICAARQQLSLISSAETFISDIDI